MGDGGMEIADNTDLSGGPNIMLAAKSMRGFTDGATSTGNPTCSTTIKINKTEVVDGVVDPCMLTSETTTCVNNDVKLFVQLAAKLHTEDLCLNDLVDTDEHECGRVLEELGFTNALERMTLFRALMKVHAQRSNLMKLCKKNIRKDTRSKIASFSQSSPTSIRLNQNNNPKAKTDGMEVIDKRVKTHDAMNSICKSATKAVNGEAGSVETKFAIQAPSDDDIIDIALLENFAAKLQAEDLNTEDLLEIQECEVEKLLDELGFTSRSQQRILLKTMQDLRALRTLL